MLNMCFQKKYFCRPCNEFFKKDEEDDFEFCGEDDFCSIIHVTYIFIPCEKCEQNVNEEFVDR
jgi:hypothetical protein